METRSYIQTTIMIILDDDFIRKTREYIEVWFLDHFEEISMRG